MSAFAGYRWPPDVILTAVGWYCRAPKNFANFGKEVDCPITEEVSNRLHRLAFYTDLTEADQACVVAALTEFA